MQCRLGIPVAILLLGGPAIGWGSKQRGAIGNHFSVVLFGIHGKYAGEQAEPRPNVTIGAVGSRRKCGKLEASMLRCCRVVLVSLRPHTLVCTAWLTSR